MTSINDLRVRLEDQFLEPVMEETPKVGLSAAITDTATTFTHVENVLSPDEQSYFGPGRVIEINDELMRLVSYDQLTREFVVKRGIRGTVKAAHAADDQVRIPTRWTRKAQTDALRAAVFALWKPLFAVREEMATVSTAVYVPLPLNTVRILGVEVERSNGQWGTTTGKLFQTHPMDNTVSSVQVGKVPRGSSVCLIRYGVRIEPPDDNSEDIEYLPENWERILLVDAAAELLSGVDIDTYSQEVLTEQLKQEGFPVMSGGRVSQNLVRYREYLVDSAQRELKSLNPVRVRFNPATPWK